MKLNEKQGKLEDALNVIHTWNLGDYISLRKEDTVDYRFISLMSWALNLPEDEEHLRDNLVHIDFHKFLDNKNDYLITKAGEY